MLREKEKAIGLLDSGLGGLSVFKEIKKQLPLEKIIYYGDTIHAPYGDKNNQQILSFVIPIIDFLSQREIKLIILACNTATAVALDIIKEKYTIPIVGIIQPGAQEAVKETKNKRVGVIGTEVTIHNKSYEKIIRALDPSIVTYSNACNSQIIREMEENSLNNEDKIRELINECINPLMSNNIDTIVLGCSHYPFLKKMMDQKSMNRVYTIDPAKATVKEVQKLLNKYKLVNDMGNRNEHSFFISGDPDLFVRATQKLLGYLPGKILKSPIQI